MVARLHPPAWEWSFFEDGNLALDSHELWEEPASGARRGMSQSRPRRPTLHRPMSSATVPRMPPPRAPGHVSRARRPSTARRVQRFAGLTVVSAVLVVTLLLTAFGDGPSPRSAEVVSVAAPLGTSGLPTAQVVATQGPLRIQMPIAQSRVTAVGYHGAGEGALRLQPMGSRGNEGVLGRLRDLIFGTGDGALVWYQLSGGRGPATSSLAVGAAPGTDVFAPVDGIVVGIRDLVIDRGRHGVRVDLQPSSAPSLVVSISRLRPDPGLTVGLAVSSARTRLGTVLDFSRVERQALAEFTQDAGNHVSIEVRPTATPALP